MATFNQQNQNVINQQNADTINVQHNGNIKIEVVTSLNELKDKITNAINSQLISGDAAAKSESLINEVITEAIKPDASKSSIFEKLVQLKDLVVHSSDLIEAIDNIVNVLGSNFCG